MKPAVLKILIIGQLEEKVGSVKKNMYEMIPGIFSPGPPKTWPGLQAENSLKSKFLLIIFNSFICFFERQEFFFCVFL